MCSENPDKGGKESRFLNQLVMETHILSFSYMYNSCFAGNITTHPTIFIPHGWHRIDLLVQEVTRLGFLVSNGRRPSPDLEKFVDAGTTRHKYHPRL